MEINLTNADINAINTNDKDYINNKGAKFYNEGKYEEAVEYYRLASAMDDTHATSNLGYCYLYGRSIPVNVDFAIQYFKLAANKGDLDAIYKLGDIYSRDKWGKKDPELAIYYYLKGLQEFQDDWGDVYYNDRTRLYPSLFFAIGRETMPEGLLNTDIYFAYTCLNIAKEGYEESLANGEEMYRESYTNVLNLLQDSVFDNVRERFEKEYKDEEDKG